jgi:hypothetical protein
LRSLAIASGSDGFVLMASVSYANGGQWPIRRWHVASSSYKLLLKAMALLAMASVSYNARYCEFFVLYQMGREGNCLVAGGLYPPPHVNCFWRPLDHLQGP